MRIDFSEPECCNCSHCLTHFQESEPRNVIGSSVTAMPVSSGPVEAFGHDSASIGSTSTSSPFHSSSPFSFGSVPAATTPVNSEPVQSLVPTISSVASQRPAFQVTSGSGASATSTSSTSSPVHSSSPLRFGSVPAVTLTSSEPTQAIGPSTFGFGGISAPTRSGMGTMQAPVQASASSPSTSFSFGPTHNCGKPASDSSIGTGVVTFARPDVGILPVSSSSTTSVVFGTTPVSVSSPFGPMQAPVQASAPSTYTFGCVPSSPASGSSPFNSVFGYPPASPSSNLYGPNPSITASGLGTCTGSVFSQFGSKSGFNFPASPATGFSPFGSAQDFPKATDSVCASSTEKTPPLSSFFPGFGVGYLPGSSSNLFRPHPSTTTPSFGGGSVFAGVKTSSPQLFGFNGATTLSPSSTFSSSASFGSNHNMGSYPSASHEWSRRTEQGSRDPGYGPTPDGETQKGMYMSISASNPYLHKSHEELRWEDYKQGCKGGLFSAAHASPIGSRPNAAFSYPNVLPSMFPPMVGTTGVDFNAFPRRTIPSSNRFNYPPTGVVVPSSTSPPSTTVPPTGFVVPSSSPPNVLPSMFPPMVGTTVVDFNGFPRRTIPSSNRFNYPPTGVVVPSSTSPPSTTVPPTGFVVPSSSPPNVLPSMFPPMVGTTVVDFNGFPRRTIPSSNGFDHPPTGFVVPSSTTVPPINSSVQRPQETATVSPPAPGCTACGATNSSSTSGHFTFNGATTPPSAATTPNGWFFPTTGFGPMMFGTTLAVQGTTPALEAYYPVQGYILLPFAAMSLQ